MFINTKTLLLEMKWKPLFYAAVIITAVALYGKKAEEKVREIQEENSASMVFESSKTPTLTLKVGDSYGLTGTNDPLPRPKGRGIYARA